MSQYIQQINEKITQVYEEQAKAPSAPPCFSGAGSVEKLSELGPLVDRKDLREELMGKLSDKTKAKDWMPLKASADILAQWQQGLNVRYRSRIGNWILAAPGKYQISRALKKQGEILDTVGS